MQSNNWLVELNGKQEDLQLIELLLDATDYGVLRDKKRLYIELRGFSQEDDPAQIQESAQAAIEIVNGASKLIIPGFSGVSFVKVVRMTEGGKKEGFGFLTLPPVDTENTVVSGDDPRLNQWIDVASSDAATRLALTLFGELEHTWKNLYLVVEVIEEDLGGEGAIPKNGLLSRRRLRRFKGTANSFATIGNEARHASLEWQPPAKPMDIREAEQTVRDLLESWLSTKSIGQSA